MSIRQSYPIIIRMVAVLIQAHLQKEHSIPSIQPMTSIAVAVTKNR